MLRCRIQTEMGDFLLKVALRRLIQIIPIMFIVITLTFVLTRMIPGDPAVILAGPQAKAEAIAALREDLGLNDSMIIQYVRYIKGVLQGDFGKSLTYKQPVTQLVAEKLPNTLKLTLTSLAIAFVLGVSIGILSAVMQYSAWDYIFMVLALVGISIPVFWLGLLLVLEFSVKLNLLPVYGMGSMEKGLWDVISHYILPCICLLSIPSATFARITRSSMLEVMHGDSIKALRARGIASASIILKHGLKNAFPPILTVLGLQLASCFTGAILTESIFAWPGMGTLIMTSIGNRDYALIQGIILLTAIAFVVINMVVDVLYMAIDPRVNYSSERRK